MLTPYLGKPECSIATSPIDIKADFATFAKVLAVCRFQLASDPRGMIYGFLGILPDRVGHHVIPQYGVPFEETYTETARLIINSARSLFIISQLQVLVFQTLEKKKSMLPGWV